MEMRRPIKADTDLDLIYEEKLRPRRSYQRRIGLNRLVDNNVVFQRINQAEGLL